MNVGLNINVEFAEIKYIITKLIKLDLVLGEVES